MTQIPSQLMEPSTVGLLLLLIAVFAIGFRILQALIDTVTVAAVSGAFYIAIAFTLDYTLTFRRVLFFSVLGSTIYTGYGTARLLYTAADTAAGIPGKIGAIIIYPLKKLHQKYRERRKLKQLREEDSFNDN